MAKRPKYGGRRPGSVNKVTHDVKAMALPYTAAAMKELGRLSVKAENEQARISAIKELNDRAFGRASQAIQHSGAVGTYDLTKVSDADLAKLEAILGPITDDRPDQGGESTPAFVASVKPDTIT